MFAFDVYDDVGPGTSIAVCDFYHGSQGVVGSGMLANEFIRCLISLLA